MLSLPPFEYHAPKTLAEASDLLARHRGNVKVVAGGTDLFPNMKHGLFAPGHVVGLKGIAELQSIEESPGALRMGAMMTLSSLAAHPLVQARLPALAHAASQVAGPQLREMGTLGGNLCLDTRCVYYNQTYFWREALGFCLKKDGTVCHVVKAGKKCVAAASNDTAPVLMTLGASVHLLSPRGVRSVPLSELYVADGIKNNVLLEDELLTHVEVPLPGDSVRQGYQKLRVRAAIDYPALSVAVAFSQVANRLEWVRLVVSALGAKPHAVGRLEAFAGRTLDDACIAELGAVTQKQCHPLSNINVDTSWRRAVLPVFVRRAILNAR